MRARGALLVLLSGGVLACIDSPAGPTDAPDSATASRPADPRFDDGFWQELIFNEHDAPGEGDFVRVLSNPSPNVYVRLGDATGTRRVVSDEQLDHIRRVVPPLAEQITGQPYHGRIETGIEERGDREGWITVRFATAAENPDIDTRCGLATPGSEPGSIWIARAVMSEAGNDTEWFTDRERYHAQLAYEVGRGAAYCGWPFSSACGGGT